MAASTWRAVAILGLAIGACACAGRSAGSEAPAPADDARSARATPPREARVSRQDLEHRLLLSGQVAAQEGATVVAPMVRIWPLQVRWIATDGAAVKAGDRLVEFDNGQLASRLDELRSKVVEANSKLDEVTARTAGEVGEAELAVERARAALRKAEIKAEVPDGLLAAKELAERTKDRDVARLELEAAQTKLDSKRRGGQAAIAGADLERDQAQRDLAETEQNIDRLVLRAPRNGIFLVSSLWDEPRPIREGDRVWPGMMVARLPDLATLVVRAQLFDVDDGLVRPGQRAQVAFDAFPGESTGATVRSVERIAEPVAPKSLRRAFVAVIDLDRRDARLRPGMAARVEVASVERAALTVPRAALAWRQEGPSLLLADGKTAPVRLGPCSRERCVVLGGPPVGTLLRTESGGG